MEANPTNAPTMNRGTDRLLIAREVAELLRVHVRLVWRMRANGQLPAIKIAGTNATRFRQSDVEKLMQPAGPAGNKSQ